MWENILNVTSEISRHQIRELMYEKASGVNSEKHRLKISRNHSEAEWTLYIIAGTDEFNHQIKSAMVNSFYVGNDSDESFDTTRTFKFLSPDPRILVTALARLESIDSSFQSAAREIKSAFGWNIEPYTEIPEWYLRSRSSSITPDGTIKRNYTFQNTRQNNIYTVRIFRTGNLLSIILLPKNEEVYARLKQTIEDAHYYIEDNAVRTITRTIEYKTGNGSRILEFMDMLTPLEPSLASLRENVYFALSEITPAFMYASTGIHIPHNLTPISTNNTLRLSQTTQVQVDEPEIPERFLCAIAKTRMTDPLIVPGCSDRCDRASLQQWLDESPNKTNPFTNEPGLDINTLVTDVELLAEIEAHFNPRVWSRWGCVIS